MRIRILDRILVAVAGLIIIALCAGLIAQVFCGVDVIGKAGDLLQKDSQTARIMIIAVIAILALIGLYCVLVLFRHRRRKDKFILQKMESGELSISLKALETMVQKCLEQHDEIETQSVHLENQRDGLLIRIRGTVAGGISIPLTVDTLQKQIKQYVTACSGVEVKGIRIQIESSGEDMKDAPFAIDAPSFNLLPRGEKKAEDPAPAETPAEDTPAAEEGKPEAPAAPAVSAAEAAMAAAENLKKEYGEEAEDGRPIHQRLFSTPEEPCIMPLPPEDIPEQPETPAEEPAEKAEAEPAEEPAVTEEKPEEAAEEEKKPEEKEE
ncbi:MAG: alkaline shock response membrane anchor protein AmaP [Clostridiales bacterium]|nr:alkaline shock response membrane anchor protein AmaP [Clostridiales bacterium]